MPIPLGILAVAGAGAAGGGGSFDLLETTVLTTTAASITFSNLGNYSAYKHLQLRMVARCNEPASVAVTTFLRFNSDSGSNYAWHRLVGTGSTVTSGSGTSANQINILNTTAVDADANSFGVSVTDILDFNNASKNTTTRNLGGYAGTPVTIRLESGFWNNTAAVTSLSLTPAAGSYIAGTRVSLYGYK
jgi:hypothetical protein